MAMLSNLDLIRRVPIFSLLTNDQAQDIADSVFMVLDDSHLIRSDQIWEQLEWLVEHLPPSVTVVLVGREAPNMALSRLRLAGQWW